MLMALCKPKMSATHSVVLFVHLKSKWLETKCFHGNGSVKTKLAQDPSCALDLSKYRVQILSIKGPLAMLVLLSLMLLLLQFMVQVSFLLVGQGRRPNFVSCWVEDGCAR